MRSLGWCTLLVGIKKQYAAASIVPTPRCRAGQDDGGSRPTSRRGRTLPADKCAVAVNACKSSLLHVGRLIWPVHGLETLFWLSPSRPSIGPIIFLVLFLLSWNLTRFVKIWFFKNVRNTLYFRRRKVLCLFPSRNTAQALDDWLFNSQDRPSPRAAWLFNSHQILGTIPRGET